MPRRSNARSPSITSQESYASVMIADMVVDVPVDTVVEEESPPDSRAETNLAYDANLDGEVNSPTANDIAQKTNGGGISRGVILNAVQYGQNGSQTKGEEKSIPMTTSMQVPEIKQPEKISDGFKEMSLGRKIAFGFSFLPSIFFVLCFAIILPCKQPQPCIYEVWKVELNDTGFTSRLEVPDNVLLTVLKQNKHALIQLDKKNGKIKEVELAHSPIYLKCGKITKKDALDCVLIDESGKFHLFDSSLGKIPTTLNYFGASFPAILSSCSEGMEDVAIAFNNTNILLHHGNNISQFDFSDDFCDSVPIRLRAWAVNGSSNIVFICDKNETDRMVSIPKNAWCGERNDPQAKPVILESGDSLKTSFFEPTSDGIVLWSVNEASMVQPNGSVLWKVANMSHTDKNQFVLHGKFIGDSEQLAFISSSLSSGLEVTLLDPANGKVVKHFSLPDIEATEVIRLEGKKRDFALLLMKKAAQDSVTKALNQIKDISTTIVNLVTNEDTSLTSQGSISEKLALLDFDDGDIDTIKFLRDMKDEAYKSTMTAALDHEVLSIYFVSTSELPAKKSTEVRHIEVANWDKSTKSKCKI